MENDLALQVTETKAEPSRHDAARRRSTLLRHFLGTLVIGLAIEFFLQLLHVSGRLDRLEDLGGDWHMALYRNVGVASGHAAVPFVYVDIDEKTYREWDEPLLLPRRSLAELIKRTLDGHPKLLIVDIDFSRRSNTGDDAVAATLAHYGQTGSATPILLARTFRLTNSETDAHNSYGQQDSLPETRDSFLDAFLIHRTNVHWASVWLKVASDAVVRRWPLWHAVCSEGRPAVLPSIPLAALALADNRAGAFDDLARQLATLAPDDCAHPTPDMRQEHELHIGEQSVALSDEGRILFTIPWRLPEGESRPLIDAGGGPAPLLTIIPARALLAAAEGPVSGSVLDGAVAVIGGSYADARDMYPTPIGRMPGALVLVNAVRTALQFEGALKPVSWWLEWSVALVVIVPIAFLFTVLSIGVATFFSLLLAVAVTLFATYWWLQAGIWLDVTAPVLGIVVHRWVLAFEHSWKHALDLGHVRRLWDRRHE